MSRHIAAVDIGGTHARFALAEVDSGKVVSLGEPLTLNTGDHSSLQSAWKEFRQQVGGSPCGAAIAVAGPVRGREIGFTNNPWTICLDSLAGQLGVGKVTLLNDFGAVAHAVAQLGPAAFQHLCGPDEDLPDTGRISIVGPGTGLGVAHIWRDSTGCKVAATEGGHIGFAPADTIDDAILIRLRELHGRASAERVASGPGLIDIHATLAEMEGRPAAIVEEKALWASGLAGADPLAAKAVEHFCKVLGSVSGDIALAQGGSAVVIAGGLGLRLRNILPASGFAERFRAKGRFERMMTDMPVKLIVHPQPGLYGAAAAFAQEHA